MSLVRLSSLLSATFVRPTQPVEIFGNISIYAIWYLGYPLTCSENFTEIVPVEPSVGRG